MAKVISKKKIYFKNKFKLVHFPRLRKEKFIVRPEEMKFVNIMMKKGYKNKYLNDFYKLQQFYKQKIRQICIKEHKTFNLHKASKNLIIYNFSYFFSLLVKKMKLRLELRVFKVRRVERRIPYLVTPWRSFRLGFNLLFKNSKDSLYIFNKDIKVIKLYQLLTEMWETFYGVSLTCKHLLDFTKNVLDNFVHYRSTQLFSIAKHRRQTFFPYKNFYFEKFIYENVIKKVKKIKVKKVRKGEKLKKSIKVKKLKFKKINKVRKFKLIKDKNSFKNNLKFLKKKLLLINYNYFFKMMTKDINFRLISHINLKKLTKNFNLKKDKHNNLKKKEKEDLLNFNNFLKKEKKEYLRKKKLKKKNLYFIENKKEYIQNRFFFKNKFIKDSFIYFNKSLNYSKFIEKKNLKKKNFIINKVKLQRNFSKNFAKSVISLFKKMNVNKILVAFFLKKKIIF